MVAQQGRRRYIDGLPELGSLFDGKRVSGWGRTNTGRDGQVRAFGTYYTDIAIRFEDGSREYVTVMTKRPL